MRSLRACDELDRRTEESMFARVIRRGWAEWLPVIVVSAVLSDDRTMPREVAPHGSRA